MGINYACKPIYVVRTSVIIYFTFYGNYNYCRPN